MSAGSADAAEGFLLEEAQELGLKRRRHLPDLVEKDRAVVGLFEQPALLLPRVGERAALVAEHLGLEQGSGSAEHVMFRNGRTARLLA